MESMVKKGKLLIALLLCLCCIGGCAGSGEDEKITDHITKIQEPEADAKENAGASQKSQKSIEGIITEQSFEVELDGWESVRFVSVAPKGNKGAPQGRSDRWGTGFLQG